MENIRIFLASSSELQVDREALEILINRLNIEWHQRNVFFELVIWENFIDAMSHSRLQDEYNKAIKETDVFVMLFWNKVGKYTEEEFNVAFQHFEETKKPFIYTYFKISPSATAKERSVDSFRQRLLELGHFETVYFNKEGLQLHFGHQLTKLYETGFKKIDKHRPRIEEYFNSLKIFNNSAYLTISDDIDKPLTDLFVPLKLSKANLGEGNVVLLENLLKKSDTGPIRILLQGNPGGGKSTLLSYIALNSRESPQKLGLSNPHEYVPMYVRLQNLAKVDDVDLGKRLIKAMGMSAFNIPGGIPENYFVEWPQCLNAKWLLLLDGYDEVDEKHKDSIDILLLQLLESNMNVVITTRPTVSMSWKLRNLLTEFILNDFNDEQKAELAHKLLPVQEDATKFIAQLNAYDRRNFSATPLMLTVSAIVFKKQSQLPNTEIQLYKEFLDIYLGEAFKRGDDIYLQNINSKTTVHRVLRKIGFLMTEDSDLSTLRNLDDNYSQLVITISELIAPKLPAGLEKDEIYELTENYIKILGKRSGVFQCTGNVCSWLHPTFREYLTADYLTNSMQKGDAENLWNYCSKWNEDRWRKIILFLIAQWSTAEDAGWIVKRIVSSALLTDDTTYCQSVIFVATALLAGAKLDEESKLFIYEQLIKLIESKITDNYCHRLVTHRDEVYGEKAAEIVRQLGDDGTMATLVEGLGQRMVAFAKQQKRASDGLSLSVSTSVFFDLRKLGLVESLMDMARDETLDNEIRKASLYTLKSERWWDEGVVNRTIKSNAAEFKLASKNKTYVEKVTNEVLQILLSMLDYSWSAERTTEILRLMKDYKGFVELRELMKDEIYEIETIRILIPEQLERADNEEIFKDETLDCNIRLMAGFAILTSFGYSEELEIEEKKSSLKKDLLTMLPGFSEMDGVDENKACLMLSAVKDRLDDHLKHEEDGYLLKIVLDRAIASFIRISAISAITELDSLINLMTSQTIENGYRQIAACKASDQVSSQEEDAFKLVFEYVKSEKHSNPENLKLQIALAQLYYKQGNYPLAKDSLGEIDSLRTSLSFAYRFRGILEKNLYNYQESIGSFDMAINLNEYDRYAKWGKAESLMNQGNYQDAINIFEGDEYYYISSPEYRWVHVNSLFKLKNYESAVAISDKFLQKDTEDVLLALRGICKAVLSPADQLQGSLNDLNFAIELRKDYYFAIYHRHLIYRRQGSLQEAWCNLESYSQVATSTPEGFDVRGLLIALLIRLGKVEEASVRLQPFLEVECTDAFCYYLNGLIDFSSDRKNEARQNWMKAKMQLLESNDRETFLDNAYPQSISNLLLVDLLSGNYLDATKCLDALIKNSDVYQLLNLTVPFIEDIVFVTGDKKIDSFKNDLLARLFPTPKEQIKVVVDPDELYSPSQPRSPYSCPMHCRLAGIQGLDIEREWAKDILNQYQKSDRNQNKRVLVLFNIKDDQRPNNVFGFCNFKTAPTDPYDFKFSDSEEKAINELLQILVQGYHVEVLLFTHKDLAKKFKEAIDLKGLLAKCLLVHFKK
ncbi:MAG: hypothetical protein JWQ09_4647 [Segetibacter sp.]|nr:hypothetical protein [Segetibacter sp.]